MTTDQRHLKALTLTGETIKAHSGLSLETLEYTLIENGIGPKQTHQVLKIWVKKGIVKQDGDRLIWVA